MNWSDGEFKLDHLGIAVESLTAGKAFYESLGLGPMAVEDVPSEQVRVGMFELANDCRVELLESTSPDGPVGKFVAKRGPGLHHVCFRVADIEEVVRKLKAQGVALINETPRVGAHNCRVVFVHPRSAGGILVELSEKVK